MKKFVIAAAAAMLAAAPCLAGTLNYIQVPSGAEVETKSECSACHAYIPAQEEPMQEWRDILENMSHHIGEDATLPEPERSDIEAYLTAHASDGPAYRGTSR